MKNHLFPLICLILALYGCSNKEQEIEELIQNKNYSDAQSIINGLSAEEKKDTVIKRLQKVIIHNNLSMLLDKLEILATEKKYSEILSLIDIETPKFQDYPEFNDNLTASKKFYAFEGADHYQSLNQITEAYQCVFDYLNEISLNKYQVSKIRYLKRRAICGTWVGRSLNAESVVIKIDWPGHYDKGEYSFYLKGIEFVLLPKEHPAYSQTNDESNFYGNFDGINLNIKFNLNVLTGYTIPGSYYDYKVIERIETKITGVYDNGTLRLKYPYFIHHKKPANFSIYGKGYHFDYENIGNEILMEKI